MATINLVVRSIRTETDDVKTFFFEKEPALEYKAGQFLTIVRGAGVRAVRRQYSFSSHPEETYPAITVRRIPNGEVSRWLFDTVNVGDSIQTTGSSGFFTLPENTVEYTKLFLLAAGSGITPIFSLMKESLRFHPHLIVVLVYSNRSEESTVFLNELRQLQKKYNGRLHIEFLWSNAHNLRRARLGKYILQELFHQHVTQRERTLAYICGPLDYRQMANVTLLAEGLPAGSIRKEIFHSPDIPSKAEPPDKEPHRVKIIYQNQTVEIEVTYPQTILQVAKTKQIILPYSCEAGRCGTCAATCLKGKIWMSRNEVLLDSETEKGRILTCTGTPVAGDAEIIIGP